MPAIAGLNLLSLTPDPLKVPPAGRPPVNVSSASFAQTDEKSLSVISGSTCTIILFEAEAIVVLISIGDSMCTNAGY
jgi:hypothetical protein